MEVTYGQIHALGGWPLVLMVLYASVALVRDLLRLLRWAFGGGDR